MNSLICEDSRKMKFHDIASLPVEKMPSICERFPAESLAKALVHSNPEFVAGILKHIRPPFADMLRNMIRENEELAESEIEAARMEILAIVEKCLAK